MGELKIRVASFLECVLSTKDGLIAVSLSAFLLQNAIRSTLSAIFARLGVEAIADYLTIAIIYAPMIACIVRYRDVRLFDGLALVAICGLLFAVSFIFHLEDAYYYMRPLYGIARVFSPDGAIYGYLLFRAARESGEQILKSLKIVAVLLLCFWTVFFIRAQVKGYWEEYNYLGELTKMSYSLEFGYGMLLPVAIFFFLRDNKNSGPFLVLMGIAMVEILIAGSRGAWLCMGVMFAICAAKTWGMRLLVYVSQHKKKVAIAGALIVMAAVILMANYEAFFSALRDALANFGVSSRTLERLAAGTITDDNGRDTIWSEAMRLILLNPIFGYGVYGERPHIAQIHNAGFPHNIVLEFALEFGVVITFLLVMAIVVASAYLLFTRRETAWSKMFPIFFVSSCQLLLSMSFWYVSAFWICVALVVNHLEATSDFSRLLNVAQNMFNKVRSAK